MTPNPSNWFSKRELKHPPSHFIRSSVPMTPDSYMWVISRLIGRFSTSIIVYENDDDSFSSFLVNTDNMYIFFEDPAEVMMYELRWSGSK